LPDHAPSPDSRFRTPAGTPAFLEDLHQQRRPLIADCSAGFMITVLPLTKPAEPSRRGSRSGNSKARSRATRPRPVMLVALFSEHVLRQLGSAEDAHLLRVEEKEIDRFTDIAVGFCHGLPTSYTSNAESS
jgi:hypothetical protein